MKTHDLKTWPDVFQAVWDGDKTAEFRRDDRGFEVGDQLRLNEWIPSEARYTTRTVMAAISHIVRGGRFGLPEGYAMLSFRDALPWGPSDSGARLCDLLGGES